MIRSWQTTTLLVRNGTVTLSTSRVCARSAMPRASISYGIQAWLRRKQIAITSCRSLGFTKARAPLGHGLGRLCGRVSLRHSAGDRRSALLQNFSAGLHSPRPGGQESRRHGAARSSYLVWLRPSSRRWRPHRIGRTPLLVLATPEGTRAARSWGRVLAYFGAIGLASCSSRSFFCKSSAVRTPADRGLRSGARRIFGSRWRRQCLGGAQPFGAGRAPTPKARCERHPGAWHRVRADVFGTAGGVGGQCVIAQGVPCRFAAGAAGVFYGCAISAGDARLDAALAAWGWGINGCASVVSAPLALYWLSIAASLPCWG